MGIFKNKGKNLAVAEQIKFMAAAHPNFKLHRKKQKFLARSYSSRKVISPYKAAVWIGNIRPTPLSREYTVKIEYQHGRKPTITVLSPELKLAEGKKRLPHTYICGSLCLYTPDRGEWHAGLSILLLLSLGQLYGFITTKSG